MTESLKNLGFFGNTKAQIPKFDEKTPRSWGKKPSVGDTGQQY